MPSVLLDFPCDKHVSVHKLEEKRPATIIYDYDDEYEYEYEYYPPLGPDMNLCLGWADS